MNNFVFLILVGCVFVLIVLILIVLVVNYFQNVFYKEEEVVHSYNHYIENKENDLTKHVIEMETPKNDIEENIIEVVTN